MNVNLILVNTTGTVKILLGATDAVAYPEHRGQTVKSTSTSVIVIHVEMARLASTVSTNTLVNVCQDTLEFIARQTLMNAHQNHVLMVEFALIL